MQMLLRWAPLASTGFYGGEGLAFILASIIAGVDVVHQKR